MRGLLCFVVAAAACGGSVKGPAGPTAERGVRAAALPYEILRADGGAQMSREAFLGEIADADAICIGESHDNPHHHFAQLTIVEALAAGDRAAGREIGLGMEMFQRPFQGVLDDYSAGKIDDATLLSRSGWGERWGYDWALYQPMVRAVVDAGGEIVALNVATELQKKVSENGIDGLGEEDRRAVPELDLADAEHRQWFDAIMSEMGGARGHQVREGEAEGDDEHGEAAGAEHEHGDAAAAEHEHGDAAGAEHEHGDAAPDHAADPSADARADRIYSVQVLWDETMADSAARWLAAAPDRRIVILAGNGHCHDSAIVNRMKRRGVARVVSIRPVIDGADSELAGLLADPINDYLFVMSMPPAAD